MLLAACNNGKDDYATENVTTLRRIDSTLVEHNHGIRSTIDSAIAAAPDSMSRYEYKSRLARYFYLSPTPDSLLPILNSVDTFANKHIQEERGRQLSAYSMNIRAAYYHAFHKEQAQQTILYRKAYDLIMMSKDKSEAHDVAANLGDAYIASNELPKAALWYRRALFLVDSLQLPKSENTTLYMGLAGIYQQLDDNENALKYYKQTERFFNKMSVGMQAYFLNNFGSYYYYLHDYKMALEKFKALRILLEKNRMQDNFDMYLCKINLADVYLNLGDIKNADLCLKDVEPFAHKNGDKAILYYCNTIRIGIAVKERDFAEVSNLAKNGSDTNGIPFQLTQIRARYMRDYYLETGNYKQAFYDLRADEAYSDSLEHNRTNMRTADIMAMFSADTLQLHHDLRMQEQKMAYQRASITLVIALALVIVLILLFIIYTLRSRKRLAEDRTRIMDLKLQSARVRISPHFVFNVLNNHMLTVGRKEEDKEILQLTKLIRENLNMSRHVVTSLEDELKFVQQYVKVEQPLVGEDLDFQINIQPGIDTEKTKVPSMMVQILVENAFKHALSGWNGHKKLHIDVTRENHNVIIAVTDNGQGFNMSSSSRGTHTGLNIIRQTIAVLNSRSRRKIIFKVENVNGDENATGCSAKLSIPESLKYKE